MPSTCFADLAGPEGATWSLAADGSLRTRVAVGDGRAFAADHGRLRVEGVVYPAIPNDPIACDRTTGSLHYPARVVGGLSVSRTVSVVQGRLRHLDSFKNTSAVTKFGDLDFATEITAGIPPTARGCGCSTPWRSTRGRRSG